MKIKNTGQSKIIFNGGVIEPRQTIILEDEKLASMLVAMYPKKLKNMDKVKEEIVVIKSSDVEELTALKERAKELGIAGYAAMKKETLEKRIAEMEKAQELDS